MKQSVCGIQGFRHPTTNLSPQFFGLELRVRPSSGRIVWPSKTPVRLWQSTWPIRVISFSSLQHISRSLTRHVHNLRHSGAILVTEFSVTADWPTPDFQNGTSAREPPSLVSRRKSSFCGGENKPTVTSYLRSVHSCRRQAAVDWH